LPCAGHRGGVPSGLRYGIQYTRGAAGVPAYASGRKTQPFTHVRFLIVRKHLPGQTTIDRFRPSAVLGCALLSVSCASLRQQHQAVTAGDVIHEYYAAVGGYDRIAAIRNRRMWGRYDEGNMHATTDIAWERPRIRRVNVHAPGFEYSEGFDGRTVWEYNHLTKRAVVDTGAAEAAARRGAEFDESFIDYAAKGSTVRLIGTDSASGKRAYRLQVTLNDGWVKDYYFDPVTHLILALRKAMPIHATGPAVESITEYDDWRQESGLLQPYKFVERVVRTGRILNTLQWDRITSNAVIEHTDLICECDVLIR
jgi:hypothetical protein